MRDWFLLTVLSIGFELLEYTLEVHLPNFGECWWDHVRTVVHHLLVFVLLFKSFYLQVQE